MRAFLFARLSGVPFVFSGPIRRYQIVTKIIRLGFAKCRRVVVRLPCNRNSKAESPPERLPETLKGVESMAKSATTLTTTTENTIKVSKVVVNKVSEIATLRTEIARLEKLANSLRKEVLDEVGSEPIVLIHNNIKVAKISVVITERPDLDALRSAFPDAWNAVKYDSPAVKISVIHEV